MERFGRLEVTGEDLVRSASGRRFVIVRCDCGVIKSTRLDELRRGVTRSCGCKKAEHGLKHGHRRVGTQDPTYTSWDSMWQRCTNPNTPNYADYGGRGISVDPRWKDFSVFKTEMGVRPSRKFEIERNNNERGYQASNCRWATRAEQMLNTRRVVKVLIDGALRSARVAAIEAGMSPTLVLQRLSNGWTIEKALRTPNQRVSSRSLKF